MDEEQHRRAFAGGEDVEETARPLVVPDVELATAVRTQSRTAALVVVINLVTFGVAFAQRVLRLEGVVYCLQGPASRIHH
ncbi:hypothetical protein MXD81_00990 [Microbacteriaceae bacterium K1510]|nr:hypothetical protein [Microbacteriaceae bacterium K1510]